MAIGALADCKPGSSDLWLKCLLNGNSRSCLCGEALGSAWFSCAASLAGRIARAQPSAGRRVAHYGDGSTRGCSAKGIHDGVRKAVIGSTGRRMANAAGSIAV